MTSLSTSKWDCTSETLQNISGLHQEAGGIACVVMRTGSLLCRQREHNKPYAWQGVNVTANSRTKFRSANRRD